MKVLRFTSDYCGPCKAMQPVIDWAVADGYPIEDVNISSDMGMALASEYGVMATPTFVKLNDNNKEVKRKIGAMTRLQLIDFMEL